MTNHQGIVEQYVKAQFPAASVVAIPDPEWRGFGDNRGGSRRRVLP